MNINKTFAPLIPDQFTASDMNQVKDELENAILGSQTLNANDVNQLGKHIANASMTNDYFIDSGIADAYVLSITGNFKSPTQLFEGMKIRFKALHSNTGASTINVAGLGVKNIKRADGSTALSAGDITNTDYTHLLYDGTNFRILSQGLIQGANAIFSGDVLASNIVNANQFINGGMVIDQLATPYTLVNGIYDYGLDMWTGMSSGTAVSTGIFKQKTNSTISNTKKSVIFENVTVTGTGISYFRTRLSGQDSLHLINEILSIGFDVLHDKGSLINYTIYLRTATVYNDFTLTTNITNSGAIAVPSGIKTRIKFENISIGDVSNGIEIEIKVEHGAITNTNFEFANAKLEIGATCSNFVNNSYEYDLRICKRYLQLVIANITAKARDGNSGGYGYGYRISQSYSFEVEMCNIASRISSTNLIRAYKSTGSPPYTETTSIYYPSAFSLKNWSMTWQPTNNDPNFTTYGADCECTAIFRVIL